MTHQKDAARFWQLVQLLRLEGHWEPGSHLHLVLAEPFLGSAEGALALPLFVSRELLPAGPARLI